ncbi:ubiquitin-like domain-containing protein [uncultured Tessaracoccus sp.]|uniref:aggregation-promoting factor C-terminal-like domain-containing protein n=1 Tax=uncultured Tessaracoccus sp. TaxID=905023 RepID=UPI002617983E|nr:ubiquitin-like domain-containing protein [uncultured Tessaracoccus sp.]
MKKSHVLIPAATAATALVLVGGMAAASSAQQRDVTLHVDGQSKKIATSEATVGDVLAAEGITLGTHDAVLPMKDARVTDGLAIDVRYGRPLTLTLDGESRTIWTTARTVQEALGFLRLDEPDSAVSVSRSAAIGRDGLSVDVVTAKDVTLVSGSKETPVRFAGTVEELLASKGITPDGDDILSHPASDLLTDGMRVEFTDVEVKASVKDVKVPFEKTTKKSDELPLGEEKVTTKGVDGLKRETFRDVYHDGKKVSSKKHSEKVLKNAVAEVTTVGTKKPAAAPTSAPTPDPKTPTATPDNPPATAGKRTGTKYDWMRAAGIPENQWQYVDYIVSKESGWNPNAKNPSSGACGLAQAYPCSKLGPNWNDPVVALRWQHNYVNSRYGGYAGAYAFWKRNRWY